MDVWGNMWWVGVLWVVGISCVRVWGVFVDDCVVLCACRVDGGDCGSMVG